jgi:hypothetical protein
MVDRSNIVNPYAYCYENKCKKFSHLWEIWRNPKEGSPPKVIGYCSEEHRKKNLDSDTITTCDSLEEVEIWMIDQTL